MAVSSFRIPGNIKQQFLPFVLNPNSPLNKEPKNGASNELQGNIGAQHFSFRNNPNLEQSCAAGFGRLQICPSSLTNVDFREIVKNDVSFRLLYGNLQDPMWKDDGLTVDTLLNSIPGIQIREFLPDTKLDQCINMFGDMIQSVKDMWSNDEDSDKAAVAKKKQEAKDKKQELTDKELREMKTQQENTKWQKFKAILWHAFDYMTGATTPNLYVNEKGESKFTGCSFGMYDKRTEGGAKTYIMNFPYMLYYRLQSCVTTNVYELPFNANEGSSYSSDGTPGWVGGSNSLGITNTFLGKLPLVGDFLKNILGNVRINFMPWWDAEKGSATAPKDVEVQFDLFNDTADAAMMNFIFVNTLVPNNKWLQYNMFQHSSCLYDVKIEGYNRLFACAASFNVKSIGVVRDPPPKWIEKLCVKYANVRQTDKQREQDGNEASKDLAETIKNGKLIKIPDVYHVSMTFKSLLPDNFNNFLYTYACNSQIVTQYQSGGIYQKNVLSEIFNSATKGFADDMKAYVKNEERIKKDIKEKEL